jgi:hypothetical protein
LFYLGVSHFNIKCGGFKRVILEEAEVANTKLQDLNEEMNSEISTKNSDEKVDDEEYMKTPTATRLLKGN